jgi:hypothetical protein
MDAIAASKGLSSQGPLVPHFDGTSNDILKEFMSVVARYCLLNDCVHMVIPASFRGRYMSAAMEALYNGPDFDSVQPVEPVVAFQAGPNLTYKLRLQNYQAQKAAARIIGFALSEALGPAVVAQIGNPSFGINGMTSAEIITALMQYYGAPKPEEVETLRKVIITYDRDSKVAINKVKHDKAYQTLKEAGREVSPADKLTNLKAAIKTRSNLSSAKTSYERSTEESDQTYEGLYRAVGKSEDAGLIDEGSFSSTSRSHVANAAVTDSAYAAADLTHGARLERLEKGLEKLLERSLGGKLAPSTAPSKSGQPNPPKLHLLEAPDKIMIKYCSKCNWNPSHITKTCNIINSDERLKGIFSNRHSPEQRNKEVMEHFHSQIKA